MLQAFGLGSASYYIRITVADDAEIEAASRSFQVAPHAGSLVVVAPAAGQQVRPGTSVLVKWSSTGLGADEIIGLTLNDDKWYGEKEHHAVNV
jgi:hypothetical protein